MTNIIVRGLVSSNISWWKHAEQKELNQPLLGSVRIKICAVKISKVWYCCNYSKDTEYQQVIPSLEINYLINNNEFKNLNKNQKLELVIDSSSLYENPGYCTEIKKEIKFLFLKCQANQCSIPLVKLLDNVSIKETNILKKVVSSEELVELLIPKETENEYNLEDINLLTLV